MSKRKEVILDISTWVGMSLGATHWYGDLEKHYDEYESVRLEKVIGTAEAKRLNILDSHLIADASFPIWNKGDVTNRFDHHSEIRTLALETWLDIFPNADVLIEDITVIAKSPTYIEQNTSRSGETLRVRLLQNIPVNTSYGLTEGKELIIEDMIIDGNHGWWALADTDDPVKLWSYEYEII